jgi:hypothetical protein
MARSEQSPQWAVTCEHGMVQCCTLRAHDTHYSRDGRASVRRYIGEITGRERAPSISQYASTATSSRSRASRRFPTRILRTCENTPRSNSSRKMSATKSRATMTSATASCNLERVRSGNSYAWATTSSSLPLHVQPLTDHSLLRAFWPTLVLAVDLAPETTAARKFAS